MNFAASRTIALQGSLGHLIDVQADVSVAQANFAIVGRADQTLSEAKERVRLAVQNSGFDWPVTRRITVLLSPADLPKSGTHYDLALAIAILGAIGKVPPGALGDVVFIGELTLHGGLRSVPGVLPMVLAARSRGCRRVFVPEPQAQEAMLVPEMEVLGVRSLAQAVALLTGDDLPQAPPVAEMSGARLLSWRGQHRLEELDMADVSGLADARFAVEVAAAGGHHLMLSGPKGAGKTTLAERIPGILPDLELEEALELTALHSLAGAFSPDDQLIRRPPFFAPHHDASKVALVGGGSGRVRPGEISRAHGGVLFLDEFPLFRTDVIEALRQPLESGEITVARGEESATFPARGMVVLAANPCPCGNFHADPRLNHCECKETVRRSYRSRMTGPITDRIDIWRDFAPAVEHEGRVPWEQPVTTAEMRERVTRARQRQAERYAGCEWRLNSQVPGPRLLDRWALDPAGRQLLDDAMFLGHLSRRGATRVHRIAWSVADLLGMERPGRLAIETALRLRTGDPLTVEALREVG